MALKHVKTAQHVTMHKENHSHSPLTKLRKLVTSDLRRLIKQVDRRAFHYNTAQRGTRATTLTVYLLVHGFLVGVKFLDQFLKLEVVCQPVWSTSLGRK